jgi:hypothetical protein
MAKLFAAKRNPNDRLGWRPNSTELRRFQDQGQAWEHSGRPWFPTAVPCTGTTGARGPQGPTKQDKKTQGNLILKPTCPRMSCRPLHRHCLRPGRLRRRLHRIVLPHLAAVEGAPVRKACVPHCLGHMTEGNPYRMKAPPYQFKVAELVANSSSIGHPGKRESHSMN